MDVGGPEQPGSKPSIVLPAWPLWTIILGHAASGVLSVVFGVVGLGMCFALGGESVVRNASGEWAGLGSMLMLLLAASGFYLPILGGVRIAASVGLFRRRRWARVLALTLSGFDLLMVLGGLLVSATLSLINLPSAALAIATLVVLFRKDYATLFRRPSAPIDGSAVVMDMAQSPLPPAPHQME